MYGLGDFFWLLNQTKFQGIHKKAIRINISLFELLDVQASHFSWCAILSAIQLYGEGKNPKTKGLFLCVC